MKTPIINKLKNYAAAIIAIATAAGFYSCADDLSTEANVPLSQQKKVSFSVTTNDYLKSTRAVPAQFIGSMTSDDGSEPITVAEVIDNSIIGDGHARTSGDATRGIPVENEQFSSTTGYNGFKMMSAIYDDDLTWLTAKATTTATNFMNKENVLGENDFETQHIWPGTSAGKKVAFFAWAPYTNTQFNTSLTTSTPDLTVANEQGTPQLTYTVPTDNVSKQFDLITATAVDVPGDHNNIQQLHFNHVLSCIKFAAGDLRDCKITDIKLTNIHYRGTYTFSDETGGMGTWQNTDDLKTICIGQGETADAADVQDRVTGEERNFVLNADDKNLMMLPQTLEQGAQLQVSFVFNSVDMNEKKTDIDGNKLSATNGTVSRTYTIDLSDRVWEPGKTYTYILSTHSVNNILLVERPKNFAYDGTTTDATFRVSSYKYVDGGKTEPLPWTVKYYAVESDGAMGAEITKPSWIESTTDAATNSTGGYQPYAMKLVAQQMTATGGAVSAITALQTAESIGTEDEPIDLSYRDVMGNTSELQNTANCYVVRQPGWYSFPLVYGNGIKGNANDPHAQNGIALGSTTKINADGNTINNAKIWLDNDRGLDAIGDAVIVWQDAPQLITPASVQVVKTENEDPNSTNCEIKFQIEQCHITQGNAVLAVRDNNQKILWNWHIWVTAADLGNTATVTTTNTNPSNGITTAELMRVPLGYCDGVTMEYKKREFFVKVTQPESGLEATFKVTQNAKEAAKYYGANAPYYQWGRPIPMLPQDGNGSLDKQYYDSANGANNQQYAFTKIATNHDLTIANSICNPFSLYYSNGTGTNSVNYNIYSATYLDLWNVGSTISNLSVYYTQTVKTIYDPCPVGFCVPCTGALSIFSTTTKGDAVSANSNLGTPKYIESTLDGTAYTQKAEDADLLRFPLLGYRAWNAGTLIGFGDYGSVRTSQRNIGSSTGGTVTLVLSTTSIGLQDWIIPNSVLILPSRE